MAMLLLLDLTRQRNTTFIIISLLFLLVTLSWWLFGLVWTLFLCAACGLSYCTTAYVCYRPEASDWREAVVEWYDRLFVWGLNYTHSSSYLQRTNRDDPPQNHTFPSNPHLTNRLSASRSEPSAGITMNDLWPPQPQDLDRRAEEDADVQPMKQCHKESQKIIQLIMRDFVLPWYTNITQDMEFPEDIQKILEHVAVEINVRLQKIEVDEVVVEFLELILPYLEVLNKAGIRNYNGVELFDVNTETCVKQFEANPKVAHHAMKSPSHERRHCRQALDALIQCVFPPEYARCDVACMFVRELLLKNTIETVFDLLCDPGFLYEAIPMILLKASPEKIFRQLDDINIENEELERALNRGRLIVNITGSTGLTKRRFHMTSGRFGSSVHFSASNSPSHVKKKPTISRPHSIARLSDLHSGIYESDSWITQSSQVSPQHGTIKHNTIYAPYSKFGSTLNGEPLSCQDTYLGRNDDLENTEEDYGEDNVLCDSVQVDSEYAFIELPPIYIERHVRVETGTGSHIAYIFKFPKWMLSDDDLKELGVLESDTHLEGIKRFSEFLKFQDVLLSSPLAIYIKGLTLPDKHNLSNIVSKLPFTSSEPDTAMIIERKQGLEKYLQSVSAIETILNSKHFKQFLKSGVKDLKEANVVNPLKNKKQQRRSFLGRVRADEQKAYPIPKRPLESVLSSYLNTNLPLPCRFSSLHNIRKKKQFGTSQQHTNVANVAVSSSPSKSESSARSMPKIRTLSLQSLASSTSSLCSTDFNSVQSEFDSLHRTDHFEYSSTVVPEIESSKPAQIAMEAIHDTGSSDSPFLPRHRHESTTSSQSSLQMSTYNEEEEGQTTGSIKSSQFISRYNDHFSDQLAPRVKTPPVTLQRHKVTFAHNEFPHVYERNPTEFTSYGHSPTDTLSRIKSLLCTILIFAHRFITSIIFIILQGTEPHTRQNTMALMATEKKRSPLTNALFSLGSEASVRHCPQLWACSQHTQLALLVLAGGGMERFLWRELKLVVFDEVNWTRALYNLRHTLWPQGILIDGATRKRSEAEIDQLKRKAADAFKNFLPNFFPHIIGLEDYDRAVIHSLDCLRNPRINRHFLLRVVDLLIMKLIPEITDKRFQKHLSQQRTILPTHPLTG